MQSFGPVDVSRVVVEMLELLKVSLSKRATLEMDLGQDLPPSGRVPHTFGRL